MKNLDKHIFKQYWAKKVKDVEEVELVIEDNKLSEGQNALNDTQSDAQNVDNKDTEEEVTEDGKE